MKRHTTKIDRRVSYELCALVEQGGERSASLRALLLIGAAGCGLDLTTVRDDIPDPVSARLHPAIQAYVVALLSGVERGAPGVPRIESGEDDALMEDDLLGGAEGAGCDV